MNQQETTKGTILLVDDDPNNLGVLHRYLSSNGFMILLSQRGERAIEQAKEEQPDLILLDVLMPGMDGFETCKQLKACETIKDIPVIFLTALSDPVDEVAGFEAGGADYITKPFCQEVVLARVNAHLKIRQQRRQIEEQNAQLHKLNATKDRFFSIIAHDLRGPLSTFRELSQTVSGNFESFSSDELKDLLKMQQTASENLYRLIENLLTWSRLQRGALEYHPQELALATLITRNTLLLEPDAQKKHIALIRSIPLKPPLAYADVNMINTVIRNLLSNAIKFTPSGGHVEVSVKAQQETLQVAVADTGIGIIEEDLPKLFRIDARYQRTGTNGEEGTGLGLILCKEFVEQNNGVLWCESRIGKGTTFSFTVPQYVSQETECKESNTFFA